MIRSMTGFGKRAVNAGGKTLGLEVKSLNSKQLDLNLRLPNVYRQREIEIRNMVAATLIRGKVTLPSAMTVRLKWRWARW